MTTHHIHHDPAVRALVERAKAKAWDEGWFAAEDFVAQVNAWNASEGATDVNEPRNPYRAAQPAPEAAPVEEVAPRWDDDPNHPEGFDCHGYPLSSGERCGGSTHRPHPSVDRRKP